MQTGPRRRLDFVIAFLPGSPAARQQAATDSQSLNPLSFLCSKYTNARFSPCDLSVSRFTVRVANAFSVFASASPQAERTADFGLWHCQQLTNTNFRWLSSDSRLYSSISLFFSPTLLRNLTPSLAFYLFVSLRGCANFLAFKMSTHLSLLFSTLFFYNNFAIKFATQ